MSTVLDPKATAGRIRATLWGSRGFPVDPVWLANEMGLDVIEAQLPERVSGALIKEADKDPVILLCATDSRVRKRFTCAHELGHYAYRTDRNQDHYEYVDLRGDSAREGRHPEEVFANQFAAELLMPEETVRELHRQRYSPVLMAQHFGVSDDAIRFRLKNLRLPGTDC